MHNIPGYSGDTIGITVIIGVLFTCLGVGLISYRRHVALGTGIYIMYGEFIV